MLSLFQSLFDYQFLALGALRAIIALFFIIEGYQKFPKDKELAHGKSRIYKSIFAGVEFVSGMFLFAGLFTQAIAVLLSVLSVVRGYNQYRHKPTIERKMDLYILLAVVSLFFLFAGPGAYGIDFPL